MLFADYECNLSGDALSTNTIIYGHTFTAPGQDPNLGFGQLNAFLDAEFAAANTQIFLSVAERQYTFEIKSAGVASAEQDGVCILASPGWAQQQELVRLANERNVIEIGPWRQWVVKSCSPSPPVQIKTKSDC